MARDTTQQNQRGQRSSTTGARRSASGGSPQSDRQTSIQTGQETGTRGQRSATTSPATSRAQGGTALSAPVQASRNDPFALMRRMQEDMDQLFSTFGFGRLGLSPMFGSLLSSDVADLPSRLGRGNEEALWSPQIETFRRGDKVVIRA